MQDHQFHFHYQENALEDASSVYRKDVSYERVQSVHRSLSHKPLNSVRIIIKEMATNTFLSASKEASFSALAASVAKGMNSFGIQINNIIRR